MIDLLLIDFEMMKSPTMRPRSHRRRNDLCMRPPKTVMPSIRMYMNPRSPPVSTPTSSIIAMAESDDTAARRAMGPKGWVNSL